MRLLTDLAAESLQRGDIVRLVHNYDLGPGSKPIDLMVFEPNSGDGLGLIVVSGYKAGYILSIFPGESCPAGTRSLQVSWLLENWGKWFCYTYETDTAGRQLPIPVAGTQVLDWTEREILATSDADSCSPRP